jgi:hypothetical protein
VVDADPLVAELRAGLEAEVRRRFGAERAAALAAEIETLADDLARVAATPLAPEVEPGFFPQGGGA